MTEKEVKLFSDKQIVKQAYVCTKLDLLKALKLWLLQVS